MMKADNYFIKSGYQCNITEDNKNVDSYTEPPAHDTYQLSVYRFLSKLFKKTRPLNVLELGFGNASKTMQNLRPHMGNYYGADMKHSVVYAKDLYPNENWIEADFNKLLKIEVSFDVIFAIDVIEHLVQPEVFLRSVWELANPDTLIVLSTPERDLVRGKASMGPPENLKHVREWNKEELCKFLEYSGFEIKKHMLVEDRDKTLREKFYFFRKGINTKSCQVILCRKRI